jgi:hypothetical protein
VQRKLCEPSFSEIDEISTQNVVTALMEMRPRGELHIYAPENAKLSEIRKISAPDTRSLQENPEIFKSGKSRTEIPAQDGRGLVLVGGKVGNFFNEEAVTAELMKKLREDNALVYDVHVAVNEVGAESFAIIAAYTEVSKVDEVRVQIEACVQNVMGEDLHVVCAK